jgi:ribosome biogenesis GTPase
MSKQSLVVRGKRAREERRREEKALKRRLEAEEALLDGVSDDLDDASGDLNGTSNAFEDASDVLDGVSDALDRASNVLDVHEAATGLGADEAQSGAHRNDASDGVRLGTVPCSVGADDSIAILGSEHTTNGPPPKAAPTEVVWSGLVAGVQRGGALTVLAEGRTYGASLTRDLVRQGYALTVGDRVRAVLDTPGRVTIVGVEQRRTKLARVREDRSRLSEFSREEAVLAANVDVAVIVAAVADPPFHPKLVDRFLVICQYGGIWPILCLNKCDLVDAPPDLSIYEQLGLPTVYASAATGAGLDDLRRLLHGRVAVFTGHSGVGKSSLVNALLGEEHQAVGAVGTSYRRGRHTTTSSSLLRLDDDSFLVDTPGVRSLGIWKIDPRTLGAYFPDFDSFSPGCRFSSCSHTHEPACGVKAAVETGELPRQRYESYLRMMDG